MWGYAFLIEAWLQKLSLPDKLLIRLQSMSCLFFSLNLALILFFNRRNKTGFAEHKDACKNTETKEKFIQSEKKDTKLPCHIFMIGHSFDFENAEILCQETNWRKRKLLEALHFELPRMHVTSIKDTALTTTG